MAAAVIPLRLEFVKYLFEWYVYFILFYFYFLLLLSFLLRCVQLSESSGVRLNYTSSIKKNINCNLSLFGSFIFTAVFLICT